MAGERIQTDMEMTREGSEGDIDAIRNDQRLRQIQTEVQSIWQMKSLTHDQFVDTVVQLLGSHHQSVEKALAHHRYEWVHWPSCTHEIVCIPTHSVKVLDAGVQPARITIRSFIRR